MKRIILFFILLSYITLSNAQDFVDVYTSKFGKQTLYRGSDNKLLSGEFKVQTSYDGEYSAINVVDGKLQGEKKDFNKDGKLISLENYKDGLLNGKTTRYYTNGTVKKEEFYSKSIRIGEWKAFNYKGENNAIENYKDGLKVGKWVSKSKIFGEDKIATTTKFYKNNKPTGTWKSVDEKNKPIWIKKYINADQFEKKEFYTNHKLKKISNLNKGKPYGTFEEYYESGTLKSKYTYTDNRITYKINNYEDGKTKFIGNYKDGKSHGKHEHYDIDGNLSLSGNYTNGKRDGVWFFQHLGDSQKDETTYVMGKKTGATKIFNANGKLYAQGFYLNNRKDATWKYYNENQKVIKEVIFEKGRKISETKHN